MSHYASGLVVTDEQRQALGVLAGSTSSPHRVVVQARALLDAADGVANMEIARRYGTTPDTVRRWRKRFESGGVGQIGRVAPGRGRKPVISGEKVSEIVRETMFSTPGEDTHWSTRTMAQAQGVSKDTVRRVWKARGLKPWLVDTFKLSNDPHFEEKLVDVVGLYLDPPERAVVLCFDEKTKAQALDRTQPSLPIKRGRAGTMTHDYKRNGTIDLFAALNVATGEVLTHCRKTHNHKDFLFFLKLIDLHVPKDLDVHLVLDNLSTHKHEAVAKWLSHPKRKRFHLHFTPTSSSWLNLVERWFRELTDKRLRRGTFKSVDELIEAMEMWAENWNMNPKPFVWHKTAAEIIEKVRRGRVALNDHIAKSAPDH